jgi:hypothetical protein
MSIERHNALRPFSREHVVGLFHAHQLMWLENGRARYDLHTTITNFRNAWQQELDRHFRCEEAILSTLPVSQDSVNKLFGDHMEIRNYCGQLFSDANPTNQHCFKVGQLLEVHIRWEEHHFFPEIESSLDADQLVALSQRTAAMEADHRGSCSN